MLIKRVVAAVMVSLLCASVALAGFCSKCGQKHDDAAKFCSKCGKSLAAEAASTKPPSDAKAYIRVQVLQTDVDVYIDGKKVSIEKPIPVLPAMKHRVRIEKEGYGVYWRNVKPRAGSTHNVSVALTKAQSFYIRPQFGFSSFTGLLGIEVQKEHLSLSLGYANGPLRLVAENDDQEYDGGACFGMKYYFRPHDSSAYLGLAGGTLPGKTTGTDREFTNAGVGVLGGYRWRLGSGFDVAAGIGLGLGTRRVLDDDESSIGSLDEEAIILPMLELAVGYAF